MTLDPMTFEYYCEKHKILKLALNDSYHDKQVRHFCLLLVLDQVILTLVDYNSFNEYSLGQIKVKMRSRLEGLSFFYHWKGILDQNRALWNSEATES